MISRDCVKICAVDVQGCTKQCTFLFCKPNPWAAAEGEAAFPIGMLRGVVDKHKLLKLLFKTNFQIAFCGNYNQYPQLTSADSVGPGFGEYLALVQKSWERQRHMLVGLPKNVCPQSCRWCHVQLCLCQSVWLALQLGGKAMHAPSAVCKFPTLVHHTYWFWLFSFWEWHGN